MNYILIASMLIVIGVAIWLTGGWAGVLIILMGIGYGWLATDTLSPIEPSDDVDEYFGWRK